jgi:hypothetical protein
MWSPFPDEVLDDQESLAASIAQNRGPRTGPRSEKTKPRQEIHS